MPGADRDDPAALAPDPTAPTPSLPTLQYAPPGLRNGGTGRVDWFPLILGLAQLVVASRVFIQRVLLSWGHFELRNPTWVTWLAWHAVDGEWMIWACVVASLIAVLGASLPPGQRRRWYFSFAAIWFACLLACVAGLAVFDSVVDVRERWVVTRFGGARPQDWKPIVVEPVDYLRYPVLLTVTNPMIVLLAFRFTQGRAAEGVAVRSG